MNSIFVSRHDDSLMLQNTPKSVDLMNTEETSHKAH